MNRNINRLKYLCDVIPNLLMPISAQEFSAKPSETKWSKKEILGHLIDSATNNHQRFVRTQFESLPFITYNQDNWVKYSYHHQMDSKHLINFWLMYNLHLFELLNRIPDENLKKECNIGKEKNVTLEWLIEDYIRHLEHHLKQLVNYE